MLEEMNNKKVFAEQHATEFINFLKSYFIIPVCEGLFLIGVKVTVM